MVDEVFVLTLNILLCVFVIVFLFINDSVFLFVFLSLFWSFQMFTFCTMSSPLFYDSVCLSHWTLFFLVPDFLVWLHPSSSLSVSFTLSLSLSIYLSISFSLSFIFRFWFWHATPKNLYYLICYRPNILLRKKHTLVEKFLVRHYLKCVTQNLYLWCLWRHF
jgi:hypothetical protein